MNGQLLKTIDELGVTVASSSELRLELGLAKKEALMIAFLLIGAAKTLFFLGSVAQMVSRAPAAVIESCFWRISSALRRHRRSVLIGETALGSWVPTVPIGLGVPEGGPRGQGNLLKRRRHHEITKASR